MAVQVSLTIIIILMNLEYTKGVNLWCYECNTDMNNRHTRECNDPYIPTPYFDLVLCPQNESQHCLKSVIDCAYKVPSIDGNVLVTVRGCVPSREIDGYCQPAEYFPGSNITCSFCADYACNSQSSIDIFILQYLVLSLILINVVSYLHLL